MLQSLLFYIIPFYEINKQKCVLLNISSVRALIPVFTNNSKRLQMNTYADMLQFMNFYKKCNMMKIKSATDYFA